MELTRIGRAVFDLFFPRRCLNCDRVVSVQFPLCVECSSKLPFTHWDFDRLNQAYSKLSELSSVETAYSLLYFRHGNVTQKLLHFLKYHNHQYIGSLLAEKLNENLDLKHIDGIIPVPIHPKKLKSRGYNQVIPFAKTLAELNNIPLIEDFLIRVENNPSQVFKNREKRMNSIQNAFQISKVPKLGHYILVDDVLTTGATLSVCVNLIHSEFPEMKISVISIAYAS